MFMRAIFRLPSSASPVVAVDLLEKRVPTRARLAVFEEDARAILLITVEVPLRPVVVRDDVIERDILVVHKPGGEARGALDGRGLAGGVAQFANLDADAGGVARAVVVGVFALDAERERLNGLHVIDREMPRHVTGAVPFRLAAKSADGHAAGVLQRGGVGVVGRVNGDVGGVQRKFDVPPIATLRDDHLPEIYLRRRWSLGKDFLRAGDFLLVGSRATAQQQGGGEDER